ncbi:MAG: hypothetical protein FJ146_18930 [Deltaproteobacteria bacterium]|nr:hypothetical protein [Deltaproteobacteria bacterium]
MKSLTVTREPRYWILILTFIAACGCKRAAVRPSQDAAQDQGSVALLDTSGKQLTAVGQCGATFNNLQQVPPHLAALDTAGVIRGVETKPELRFAVLSALAAVPRSLLQLLFVNLQGQLVVGDAASLCKDTPLSPEEKEMLGKEMPGDAPTIPACWIGDHQAPLRLVVAENSQVIRGVLLRLFAYMYSEYFMARVQDPGAPSKFRDPQWQELINNFADLKARLTLAYLADHQRVAPAKIAILERFRSASPQQFTNMIFANAVDSYFCTAMSRQSFATTLPQTFQVFTDVTKPSAPLKIFGLP